MKKTFCDRCKKEILTTAVHIKLKYTNRGVDKCIIKYDLCPECAMSIKRFVEESDEAKPTP